MVLISLNLQAGDVTRPLARTRLWRAVHTTRLASALRWVRLHAGVHALGTQQSHNEGGTGRSDSACNHATVAASSAGRISWALGNSRYVRFTGSVCT